MQNRINEFKNNGNFGQHVYLLNVLYDSHIWAWAHFFCCFFWNSPLCRFMYKSWVALGNWICKMDRKPTEIAKTWYTIWILLWMKQHEWVYVSLRFEFEFLLHCCLWNLGQSVFLLIFFLIMYLAWALSMNNCGFIYLRLFEPILVELPS